MSTHTPQYAELQQKNTSQTMAQVYTPGYGPTLGETRKNKKQKRRSFLLERMKITSKNIKQEPV